MTRAGEQRLVVGRSALEDLIDALRRRGFTVLGPTVRSQAIVYAIDEGGTILDAKIVPPTSQNQRRIEEDLRESVQRFADLPDDELQVRCEQTIRNYDPCISCATHFLDLEMERL